MRVTYIHHSSFLVETEHYYYLFDYEKGFLPKMDVNKPIYVLSSHGHHDHYNVEIFSILKNLNMKVHAILSDDIEIPSNVYVLQVSDGKKYILDEKHILTTFKSTDLGVAFLIEDEDKIIYHAGDLNDWVWDDETDAYNEQMTFDYRKQIGLLSNKLNGQKVDVAFVVLDPRQEKDYDRGLCYFLEHILVEKVYPMHYWGDSSVVDTFLQDHPEYNLIIQKTE